MKQTTNQPDSTPQKNAANARAIMIGLIVTRIASCNLFVLHKGILIKTLQFSESILMPANDWPWCRKSAPTPNDFIRHIVFLGNFLGLRFSSDSRVNRLGGFPETLNNCPL